MPSTDPSALTAAGLAALAALEGCTLTDLQRIELYHFRRVKALVAKRTAAACHARVEREAAGVCDEEWSMEDRIAQRYPVVPPESADMLVVPDDDDDPEIDEPTVTEEVDPQAGMREHAEAQRMTDEGAPAPPDEAH